jgi:probable HAF family extracellular repeat protein
LGGSYSLRLIINEAGQVIGYSATPGDVNFHAFLWEGGVMTDWVYNRRQSISNALLSMRPRQIIGKSSTTASDTYFHCLCMARGCVDGSRDIRRQLHTSLKQSTRLARLWAIQLQLAATSSPSLRGGWSDD